MPLFLFCGGLHRHLHALPTLRSSDLSAAAPIERYVVLEYLSEGGMGAIYLGKKLGAGGFEKEVVLKQLLPEFTQQPERSEEHTSEFQSRLHLVCRLLLEKKKTNSNTS